MSYRVANILPVRRVRRMIERQRYGTTRSKISPILASPQRVVIRLQSGVEPGEELLLLGAIRRLKTLHDRINLEYCTESQEIFEVLKGNWFLRKTHLISSDSSWDELVGDDFGLILFDPDPQASSIMEESFYKSRYEAELASKTAQQQDYIERGMKDLLIEMPTYNFHSRWNKTNAYLWDMVDRLGLQVTLPIGVVSPYGEVNKEIRRNSQALAARAHITDTPFGIYDFRGEVNEIVLVGVTGKALDPIRLFSIQEVIKEVGGGIDSLLGVLSSHNCQFVAAPVGDLLVAAWAADVKNILTMYTGSNPMWDAAHPANGNYLGRDSYEDDQLPQAIYQSLIYMKETWKTVRRKGR